jgi:hypothetical protein
MYADPSACKQRWYRANERARAEEKRSRRLVQVYDLDALIFLRGIHDDSVDLIVSDFPYGNAWVRFMRHYELMGVDYEALVVRELLRVLKPHGRVYLWANNDTTMDRFKALMLDAGFGPTCRHSHNWFKTTRAGNVPRDGKWAGNDNELVGVWSKGAAARFVGPPPATTIPAPRPSGLHAYPTEKPGKVLRAIIAGSTRAGDLVIDPFCGSGSVGIAARALGRRAWVNDITAAQVARPAILSPGDAQGGWVIAARPNGASRRLRNGIAPKQRLPRYAVGLPRGSSAASPAPS